MIRINERCLSKNANKLAIYRVDVPANYLDDPYKSISKKHVDISNKDIRNDEICKGTTFGIKNEVQITTPFIEDRNSNHRIKKE